jgi:hypothetical protein
LIGYLVPAVELVQHVLVPVLRKSTSGNYRRSLALLAAAVGSSAMLGRTGTHASTPVTNIVSAYFLGGVTISHTWSDVGPSVWIDERPKAGSILHTGPGVLPIFYDVMIPRKALLKLGGQSVLDQGADAARLTSEMEEWYQQERSTLVPPPTREDDEQAVQLRFSEAKKIRPNVRYLRKKYLTTRRDHRKSADN